MKREQIKVLALSTEGYTREEYAADLPEEMCDEWKSIRIKAFRPYTRRLEVTRENGITYGIRVLEDGYMMFDYVTPEFTCYEMNTKTGIWYDVSYETYECTRDQYGKDMCGKIDYGYFAKMHSAIKGFTNLSKLEQDLDCEVANLKGGE